MCLAGSLLCLYYDYCLHVQKRGGVTSSLISVNLELQTRLKFSGLFKETKIFEQLQTTERKKITTVNLNLLFPHKRLQKLTVLSKTRTKKYEV